MYCRNCGKEIQNDCQYCKFCGKYINEKKNNIHIQLSTIIILIVLIGGGIGIMTYLFTNNNSKKQHIINNNTIYKNETNSNISNNSTANNSIDNSEKLTGIEKAIQDGMISTNYLTEGVSEDTLKFAYSNGVLNTYYNNWEQCLNDAIKLNIIKKFESIYTFPKSVETFPIEVGDTVKTKGRKNFRSEPSYESTLLRTTQSVTTAIEIKDNWVNTYLGWIPSYDLEGEKPVALNISLPKNEIRKYIEVYEDCYITDYITIYLNRKKGSLAEALRDLSNVLNFELKQENNKTYINSITGVPNLKGLTNNETYKWIVMEQNKILDNLDEIDIQRIPTLTIEYKIQT